MTQAVEVTIREAKPGDAPVLAELMNAAGDGLPMYLWGGMAGPGEDAMSFAVRRVAGADGGFSYTRAHVAVAAGDVIGMLLGYRLADPYDASGIGEAPEVVQPLLELEAEAPGTWYVNAVAAADGFRGRGVGTRLMRLAEDLAAGAGADALSLIVAEDNAGAVRLYERLAYEAVARRAIVPYPGCPHHGDWLLMRKAVPAGDVR